MLRYLWHLVFVGFLLANDSHAIGADLATELEPVIAAHQGEVSVMIRHLVNGKQFSSRADMVRPTASLIKLPVMVAAYRLADSKQLDLSKTITLTDADKVPGSGILTDHFSSGVTLPLQDAIRLMIRYSDNTATNLVIDQIGLPTTAAMMESLGFSQTRLNSKVYRGQTTIAPERSRLFGLGSTTAEETVDLLEQLHRGTIASSESCKAMIDHLLVCDEKTMIVRELPRGTKVAQKSGAISTTRCNAGIVYGPSGPFAICVITTNNKDRSWDDDNAAHMLIGRISKIAFDQFNPERDRQSTSEPVELRVGAFGTRVELMQRTLNARMTPSPNLGVDGDFGPATEAAVRKFQETSGQTATGITGTAFWKTLGPVVDEMPVADPAAVNSEILAQQPMDSLDGRPFVTSKSWIVVDAENGRMIAGQDQNEQKHFASTTKIMTAWLVIQLAERQTAILDETLTMSTRADQTRGSTSDIRTGEMLTVREALYGLLLPSGNDMSVALAEHFGARVHQQSTAIVAERLPSVSVGGDADPLAEFVTAMNSEATRLGMLKTRFTNPHGLSAADHLSTAADLAALAKATLGSELFKSYVSTRQRGASVTGPGGYLRNVMWKNTNELLAIDGYSGVKTGTTDQAGACLVSTGERDGRRLIVVVLGSAASESRYVDSRNLYRWGWKLLKNPELAQ